jgi:hypothetical protein
MAWTQRAHRRLGVEPLEDRRVLAVLVDTHLDVVDDDDGLTSLREAIIATNAAPGADVIDFDPSLAGKTIQLSNQGMLNIRDDLTINGLGADQLTVRGGGGSVFWVGKGWFFPEGTIDVTINGLTITGGSGNSSGAGIRSTANLTVADCVITNNRISVGPFGLGDYGSAAGGGIAALGGMFTTNIIRTVISDNVAPNGETAGLGTGRPGGNGGGLAAGGTVNIVDSVITRNRAGDGTQGYRGQDAGDGGGISVGGTVTITCSIISDNHAGNGARGWGNISTGPGGKTGPGGDGGGIAFFNGSLTIIDSVVSNNFSGNGGTNINHSIAGPSGSGAGIYFTSTTGPLSITNSTIIGNRTPDGQEVGNDYGIAGRSGDGGGVWASGAVQISTSTIAGNGTGRGAHGRSFPSGVYRDGANAGDGGGLWLGGAGGKSIVNSTISGNFTGAGGNDDLNTRSGSGGKGAGLWIGGTGAVTIAHSTISNNEAGLAGAQSANGLGGGVPGVGGVFNAVTTPSVALNHTIVAGNRRGPLSGFFELNDLAGAFSSTYSLIGVEAGGTITDNGGSQIGTAAEPIDPLLAPLADNGGPTQTHALLEGSTALNAGDSALAPGVGGTPATDQRGGSFSRVVGAAIDIGAFEAPAPTMPADFDGDNDVDGHDFLAWQRGEGDANGDDESDGEDLTIWMDSFGEQADLAASTLTQAALPSSVAALAASLAIASDIGTVNTPERSRDEAIQAAFATLATSSRSTSTPASQDRDSVEWPAGNATQPEHFELAVQLFDDASED